MAPKCKWCGEAQAHRKSALARIALAFVESDLESSKDEVAPTWEVRKSASSYKDLCKTCISEEGTYPGHSIANKLQDGGQHITMCRKGKDVIVRREQLDTFIETEIELVAKPDWPKYLVMARTAAASPQTQSASKPRVIQTKEVRPFFSPPFFSLFLSHLLTL
jgi:hypothetical protein